MLKGTHFLILTVSFSFTGYHTWFFSDSRIVWVQDLLHPYIFALLENTLLVHSVHFLPFVWERVLLRKRIPLFFLIPLFFPLVLCGWLRFGAPEHHHSSLALPKLERSCSTVQQGGVQVPVSGLYSSFPNSGSIATPSSGAASTVSLSAASLLNIK